MIATMPADESGQETGDYTIASLSQDERLMLVEIAQILRDRTTQSLVAREALDRVAAQLIRIAAQFS